MNNNDDTRVGVYAFANTLGVDLSAEPQLEAVIHRAYFQAHELVDKARLQASAQKSSSNSRSTSNVPGTMSMSVEEIEKTSRPPSPQRAPVVAQQPPSPSAAATATSGGDIQDLPPPLQKQPHHNNHHQQQQYQNSNFATPYLVKREDLQQQQQQQQPEVSSSSSQQQLVERKYESPVRNVSPPASSSSLSSSSQDRYNEDVLGYARFIGVNPETESYLLPIAKEGLYATLPPQWTSHRDIDGTTYYANKHTGVSTFEHPLDETYRIRVADARVEHKRRHSNNNNNNSVSIISSSGGTLFVNDQSSIVGSNSNNNNTVSAHRSELTPSQALISYQQQPPNNNNNNNTSGERSRSPSSGGPHKGVEDRVEEFAEKVLGIDVIHERNLIPLAREMLLAPLPGNWRSYRSVEGDVYYAYVPPHSNPSRVASITQWEHPSLDLYLRKVREHRKHRGSDEPALLEMTTNTRPAPGTPGGGNRSGTTSLNNSPTRYSQQQQQSSSSSLRSSPSKIVVGSERGGNESPHSNSSLRQRAGQMYPQELIDYAKFLGVADQELFDSYIMKIVEEGFTAPLPPGWKSYRRSDTSSEGAGALGEVYYAKEGEKVSSYDHPLDGLYKHKIIEARRERAEGRK